MKYIISIIGVFLFNMSVYTSQIAITEDGKKVILNDDRTWEYVKETQTDTFKDFKEAKWGMSKNEIKKLEKGEIIDENTSTTPEILIYREIVAGLEFNVVYFFVKDKLVRSKYMALETLLEMFVTKGNDYIIGYITLKKLLIDKYGKPTKDKQYGKNDRHKDDYQHWGSAISAGDLSYFTNWETERTSITLALYGHDYRITLVVGYKSKGLAGLEEEEIQRKF